MIIEPERVDWERLYRWAYPSVYRALVATLFDLDLAADVLQDAFVAGLDRPPLEDTNIPGWLFRVAIRKAGRTRRPRTFSLDTIANRPMASPIDALLDQLAVGELLRLLTARQRSIVVAYFYLDQTQEQIAELLGIRRGTVAATISQALARMRKAEGHVQGTA